MSTIAEHTETAIAALDGLRKELELVAQEHADFLDAVDSDLGAMLDELADSEDACREHFDRFPGSGTKDGNTEESRAHWLQCFERRELAGAALLKYARARRLARAS